MNLNYGKFDNLRELSQVRRELEANGQTISDENWATLGNICRDRIEIRMEFRRNSADWRELISRLIQEIDYRRIQNQSNLQQSLIQDGKTSALKDIDIFKDALILFDNGAVEIYLYQPEKKRSISKEMQNSLEKLLKERGIRIGFEIKNCSLDQGDLIRRLLQELQAIQEEYQPQDKLGLFYYVIQDGKVLKLKEFDKTKQALFVLGDQYEMEIYLYKLN